MKRQFAEFLLKRLSGKVDDVKSVDDLYEIERITDDMDEYIETLKEIIMETLLP